MKRDRLPNRSHRAFLFAFFQSIPLSLANNREKSF
jgi:hypothetical protein